MGMERKPLTALMAGSISTQDECRAGGCQRSEVMGQTAALKTGKTDGELQRSITYQAQKPTAVANRVGNLNTVIDRSLEIQLGQA